jgi:hypothetical protein
MLLARCFGMEMVSGQLAVRGGDVVKRDVQRKIRRCPVNKSLSFCDGLCEVAIESDLGDGESFLWLCPVRAEALDRVLNC